jgi:hypothetical protein
LVNIGINEAAEKVDLSDDRFCPNGTKIATAVEALHEKFCGKDVAPA